MRKSLAWAGAFALVFFMADAAAAGDQDLEEIRAQLRELKSSYEARIQALEQRLREAEQKAQPAAPSPATGIAAFNPAVSAVLQGRYANLSRDPSGFRIAG